MTEKLVLHPDEVFQGIIDYVASTGYTLQTSSKIDLSFFNQDFMTGLNIEAPVYSYKGISLYANQTSEEDTTD